jgi:hypothetical protein
MYAPVFEIGIGIALGAGGIYGFQRFSKRLTALFTVLHARFSNCEKTISSDVADAKSHLAESKAILADLKISLAEVKLEFHSALTGAESRLAGMDRKVCSVCKRLVTKFETDANGIICVACKGGK